ncbi:MAG: Xaa-Pro aminopeptidase, partial [Flavobacteriales bacterium]
MKYDTINSSLFSTNRSRFTAAMKPTSIAIFNSNDQMPRSGDSYFPFRQNSGLFSLCGIDQEETVLVLYPDCVKENMREVLFIRKTN